MARFKVGDKLCAQGHYDLEILEVSNTFYYVIMSEYKYRSKRVGLHIDNVDTTFKYKLSSALKYL